MDASNVHVVDWSGYVDSVTSDGPTIIASRIGVSGPTVSRWWGTTLRPRPEHVAEFARKYGRPVLEAFLAAGFLTPKEADQQPSARPSLATLSDEELLEEVRARMKGERAWHGKPRPEDELGIRVARGATPLGDASSHPPQAPDPQSPQADQE